MRFFDLRITYSGSPNAAAMEATEEKRKNFEEATTPEKLLRAWEKVLQADKDKPSELNDKDRAWYMQHMVLTRSPAITFLKQIHEWMKDHPSEIIVVWMTYHGDASGTDDYPPMAKDHMLPFWKEIKELFGTMLFDNSKHKMNEATVGELVESGERVAMYVQQWADFTGSDSRALDSKDLINNPGSGKTYGDNMYGFCDMRGQMSIWKQGFVNIAKDDLPKDKKDNK